MNGELNWAAKPDADGYVVWHTRQDGHACAKCAARDGHRYRLDDLPNWPGAGAFGEHCELGWGCRCSLSYIEAGRVLHTYSPTEGRAEAARQELEEISANEIRYRESWRAGRQALYEQITADAIQRREAALGKAQKLAEEATAAELAGKAAKARDLRTRAENWRERSTRSHDALHRAQHRDAVTEAISRELGVLPQDVPASEVALRLSREASQ
jgi:hypothetical protein